MQEIEMGIRGVCFRTLSKLIVAWDEVTLFFFDLVLHSVLTKIALLWVDSVTLQVLVSKDRKHFISFKNWIPETLCCQAYHFVPIIIYHYLLYHYAYGVPYA